MEPGLCENPPAPPVRQVAQPIGRRTAPGNAVVLLRDAGQLPAFGTAGEDIRDPSPLRGLSPDQRARRLVGLLELLASYGDGAAAAEALRHHRWAQEMKRGKAPQRIDLHASGQLTVVDTLSAPAGTPIPARPRRAG